MARSSERRHAVIATQDRATGQLANSTEVSSLRPQQALESSLYRQGTRATRSQSPSCYSRCVHVVLLVIEAP